MQGLILKVERSASKTWQPLFSLCFQCAARRDVSGYLATHSNGRRRVFSVELSSRSSSRANNSGDIMIRVLELHFPVRKKIKESI